MTTQARWAVAILVILGCTCAWAQTSDPRQPTATELASAPNEAAVKEEIEDLDIEEIADVSEVATVPDSDGLTWTEIIGRMHPAAVHFPIGWVFLLLLWELGAVLTRRRELELTGPYLVVGAALSLLPAVATGLLRAGQLQGNPQMVEAISAHRNVMLLAAAVLAVTFVVRLSRRHTGPGRFAYLVLLLAASVLVGVGGHLGGKLVYGDTYLPF